MKEDAQAPREGEWSTLPDRAGVIFGGAMGVLLLVLLVHPNRAEPGRHLLFYLGLLALGAVMSLQSFALRPRLAWRVPLSLGFIGAVLYGLWWLVRWRSMTIGGEGAAEVRAPWAGSAGVATALALLPAMIGAAGAVITPIDSERPLAARTLRWTLFISIFAFAAHALYQRFIGYDQQLRDLREALAGRASMSPLMAQSMIHALEEKRVGGPFGNGNLLAACVATLTAFAPSIFFEPTSTKEKTWLARGLAVTALGLGLITVILTGSRGGALSWVAAVALGTAAAWRANGIKRGRRPNGAAPTLAALGLALALALAARGAYAESFFERLGRSDTIRERFYYWGIATELVSDSPITGKGPGAFELYYPSLKPPKARESRYAHSWIFQNGAEAGALGLILFLGIVTGAGAAVMIAWRTPLPAAPIPEPPLRSDEINRELLYFGAAAATLLFNGLFEYSMQTREFTMLLGGLAGAVIGLSALRSREPEELNGAPEAPLAFGIKLGVGVVSALVLTSLIIGAAVIYKLQMGAVWEWRGRVSAQIGEHAQAAEDYSRALEWTPRNDAYLASRALALIAADAANAPEAIKLIERAEAMNPLSARLRQEHARLLLATNKTDLAAHMLDEAVRRNPNDAGVRLERAELNLRLKRTDAAREDLLYIRDAALPLWEYQEPEYNRLKSAMGMP